MSLARLTVAIMIASALAGCGDSDGSIYRGGADTGADTDTETEIDSGDYLRDSGRGADAGVMPPLNLDDAFLAGEPSVAGNQTCYTSGCGVTPACTDVRSCCVGSGACCADVLDGAPDLTMMGCEDGDPSACVAEGTTFGTPNIVDDALAPGGDGLVDSGLVADEPVDLTTHRLRLEADFFAPTACTMGCFETAAVGVTTQASISADLRPLVALQYSAARQQVLLIVADVVVFRDPDPDLGAPYILDLEPTGDAVLRRPGIAEPLHRARFRPSDAARVALFGRTLNPSAGVMPTRVRLRSATLSLCDLPKSWTGRAQVLVDGAPIAARGPSLVAVDGRRALAYERDGEIYVAAGGAMPHEFVAPMKAAGAAQATFLGGGAIGDPELVAHDDGYSLFFTVSKEGAPSAIGRQELEPDFSVSEDPTLVTINDPQARGFAEPSVLVHPSGEWVLSVRAESEGAQWLAVYRARSRDAPFEARTYDALRTLSRRPSAQSGFDRDALGQPSLSIHNGAWHLHYTGRRSTREGVGLILSDDLLSFRRVDSGPVLAASDADWERLAAGDADVAADGDALEIVYVGSNGSATTLGWARRVGTDAGSFW